MAHLQVVCFVKQDLFALIALLQSGLAAAAGRTFRVLEVQVHVATLCAARRRNEFHARQFTVKIVDCVGLHLSNLDREV